ncbi:hypothetical protein C9J03_10805 [Photobacterium gaetbulicola]|uniref:SPOR domain-containing protein n=1 Tax=Photobacterium gaetbulicola Gung47 TaxID=658445 RepID=A0A0C5WA37_9GAMM|nr:hypothetical protein [Photobacterium gaetbulicola]AJR08431.1 hypothetical protein H744_2c1765 [Photobacterium gaetbulicola Gung47]PSU12062.1 hypothetical protein C9J03_10805 [Photobacterium gaetbulicola]
MVNKIKLSLMCSIMLTGCIQLDPYQKYHTALNSDQCVPDINTTYTETVYEPALSENTAEYTISESGFDSGFGTDNDDTASRPTVEVTAINAIPEMTSEDILPTSVEFEEQQFYAIETTSSNYSDGQFSTEKISSTLGREEALYVQVFATLDEVNAKNVLRDVRLFFPEQTSVIRSAGIYRILIGPLEKDETTFVVNEINKQSDYSTAFVLSHFSDISDDEI